MKKFLKSLFNKISTQQPLKALPYMTILDLRGRENREDNDEQ
jgi:hypothetical protein